MYGRLLLSFIIGVLLSTLLVACATTKPEYAVTNHYPISFNQAIRVLVTELIKQASQEETVAKQLKTASIVLDPFIDVASGNVVKVSREIERILVEEINQTLNKATVARISSHNRSGANYVINGTINFEKYQTAGEPDKASERHYRATASLIDLQTARILANFAVWITETDLDYTPIPAHQDSPNFDKNIPLLQGQIDTVGVRRAGELANRSYYDKLDTQALLVEADGAYEKENYQDALRLYEKASERLDGQITKTYAGLYIANYKLKDVEVAEEAFARLLEISMREVKRLNIKLFFQVDSTEFVENADLRNQYALWLRQIAKFFRNDNTCFQIVGHSSRSGDSRYNKKLSLSRAKKVQDLLKTDFPGVTEKSVAIGRGFEENLVGSGTDDARDAIDRRVEFIVTDCPKPAVK